MVVLKKKVVNNFTEALQKQKYDAIAPLVVSDKANDEKKFRRYC